MKTMKMKMHDRAGAGFSTSSSAIASASYDRAGDRDQDQRAQGDLLISLAIFQCKSKNRFTFQNKQNAHSQNC
jgi:hypothetical protein